MKDEMIVIGIDCAAQSSTVGLALGKLVGTDFTVLRSEPATNAKNYAGTGDRIVEWIKEHGKGKDAPILLALDAPLGWPAAMGPFLSGHSAGEPTQPSEVLLGADDVGDAANMLFRRRADHVVASHLRDIVASRRNASRATKNKEAMPHPPLDIGADKIARVAHATLCLLARVRRCLSMEIPLSWHPGVVEGVQAIEVYPTATLYVHGLMVPGYKSDKGKMADLVGGLREYLVFRRGGSEATGEPEAVWNAAGSTDHALDAVVCCLAAADFLEPDVVGPKSAREWELAKKEGWIWVAEKGRPKP